MGRSPFMVVGAVFIALGAASMALGDGGLIAFLGVGAAFFALSVTAKREQPEAAPAEPPVSTI